MRRLNAGSESDHRADDGTAKCPESLCPRSALPPLGRRGPPPPRTLLPVLCSYGLMRQSRWLSPASVIHLVPGVFAGCCQPLLPTASSRLYLCKSFPRCLVPCYDGPTECFYLFLPRCHRPSPRHYGSASRFNPRTRLSRGLVFRGCRHFVMFRPPSWLASRIAPTAAGFPAGQLRRLHPSRTYVVTFARIGYASRPTTGNWRHEDFHLARFTALSTAPSAAFPPHSPPTIFRLCSNDSSVLFRCVTPQRRACEPCGLSLRPPSCSLVEP